MEEIPKKNNDTKKSTSNNPFLFHIRNLLKNLTHKKKLSHFNFIEEISLKLNRYKIIQKWEFAFNFIYEFPLNETYQKKVHKELKSP